uniref:Acyl-CoA oxidase C-terminal domain-containing protein n=1 Tax=Glossina austeni TaxID=7395 RepID=A0A1A9VP24_GLOAU
MTPKLMYKKATNVNLLANDNDNLNTPHPTDGNEGPDNSPAKKMALTALTELQALSQKVSPALSEIFQWLLELYLVDACLQRIGDFLRFIKLTEQDVSGLESHLQERLKRLRPNVVTLVDGFDLHDRILDSALGAYDGNVYEKIFAAAKKSPLNKEAFNGSFHKYLRPLMKSNL